MKRDSTTIKLALSFLIIGLFFAVIFWYVYGIQTVDATCRQTCNRPTPTVVLTPTPTIEPTLTITIEPTSSPSATPIVPTSVPENRSDGLSDGKSDSRSDGGKSSDFENKSNPTPQPTFIPCRPGVCGYK